MPAPDSVHQVEYSARGSCGCIPAPIPVDQHDGLGIRCLKCGYGCVSRLHLVEISVLAPHERARDLVMA